MILYRYEKYILKRFLLSYLFSLTIILSIFIVFDIKDKIGSFTSNHIPLHEIVWDYYAMFIPYYGVQFSPMFLYLSLVFFTSKILLESYFNASPPYTKVRYACWGADLAKRLRQMGCRADFIGATQRPPLLAKQFQLILKKDRVVFPVIKNAPSGIGSLMTGSHVILLEMGVQKQSTLHLAETFDMAFLNNLQQTEAFIKNRATARTYVVSSRSAGKLILSRGIKAVQEWEGFDDFGIWMGIQQFK